MLLARALWGDPGLVLSTSPPPASTSAPARTWSPRLADLAADPATPPTVLVTHHVEEIPPGFTHALLVGDGRVAAPGPARRRC